MLARLLVFVVIAFLVAVTAVVHTTQNGNGTKETHQTRPELPPPEPRLSVTLATAKDGELVRLVGRVKPAGDPMLSPLTGKICVASLVRAHVWHSRKIPQLIDELRDVRLVPFAVEVHGGEVIIEGAITIAMPTARATPRTREAAHALLAAHKLERFLESSDFEETLIQSGDRIAVIGVIAREQGAAGYRDVPVERVRLVPHARMPVTLTAPGSSGMT